MIQFAYSNFKARSQSARARSTSSLQVNPFLKIQESATIEGFSEFSEMVTFSSGIRSGGCIVECSAHNRAGVWVTSRASSRRLGNVLLTCNKVPKVFIFKRLGTFFSFRMLQCQPLIS